VLKAAWNCYAAIDSRTAREVRYWMVAIPLNRGQFIKQVGPRPSMQLANDAGEHMWGGTLNDGMGNKYLAQGRLPTWAVGRSSTLREVIGHQLTLQSFEATIIRKLAEMAAMLEAEGAAFACREVDIIMDSQSGANALEIGSSTEDIQDVVVDVFMAMERHSLVGNYRWVSRNADVMSLNDDLSKLVDNSDFSLNGSAFDAIEAWTGYEHTIDRFASSENNVCKNGVFNSKLFSPGCDEPGCAVDAWSQNWLYTHHGHVHYNWLHPPYARVAKTVRHLRDNKARGTILVPLDTRQVWWPMLATGAAGVGPRLELESRPGLLLLPGGVWPKRPPRTNLLAVQLDFTQLDLLPAHEIPPSETPMVSHVLEPCAP
jgi:hypothetical protein